MDTQQSDLLEAVRAELKIREGGLQTVAKGTGITYDTIRRIKNGRNDPGYSKVRLLHDFLFGRTTV